MTAATQGMPGRRPLRRDIEGLRAVAVLMVLAFHLGLPGAEGGFAGVDVFFVISGFLITGLLVREVRSTGRVDLLTFYARRARRLLPAALLVIVLTFAAGWWLLPGSEQLRLSQDSLGATLYVVNWVLAARSVDYLAEDASPSPLQHYWSLSVEEQFYLVWPLLILLGLALAARRRAGQRSVVATLLGTLAVSSFAWGLLATLERPAQAYFVTTTRLWELAAGALLVFALPSLSRLWRPLRETLVLGGLGAIVATVVIFGPGTPWPGWAAAVPVLASVAVIAGGCASGDTVGGRILSISPLVWLGGLSYAVYLWHWPLVVLTEARLGPLDAATRLGLGVASILLAWATKHLVEDPIRFNRWLSARSVRSLATTGAMMALVSVVVLGTMSTRPSVEESIASELPSVSVAPTGTDAGSTTGPATKAPVTVSSGPGTLVADVASSTWVLRDDPSQAYTTHGPIAPLPDHAPDDAPSYYDDGCQIGSGDPEPRHDCVYGDEDSSREVVLLGDSKAGQWFSAVDAIAQQEGWRLQLYLKSACPFTVAGAEDADCDAFGQAVVDHLASQAEPPVLALVSTGAGRTPELLAGATEALRALREHGTEVVLISDNPYPPGSRYPCAAEHLDDLRECAFEPGPGGGNDLLGGLADRLDLDQVDLNEWICPEETVCPVAVGERLIWRQGSHITDTYARNLTPFLYRHLSRLGLTDRPVGEIAIDDVPARRAETR